jgi:SAM-dependent methyltransferase
MADYALDNSWDRAKRRLSLSEQYLDPMTKRRMTALGIHEGLRCLEVGAGGGSVAAWLCEQIGPAGRVVATDINIQLLQDINRHNFEAIEHDIAVDSPPGHGFDFVHTRWLLHHLPEPELAIRRNDRRLTPRRMVAAGRRGLLPGFWARALPGLVAGMGLRRVGGEGNFSVLQGGSPVAEFFCLTAEQMRERIIGLVELSADRLNEALRLLKSPDFWAFGGAGVAVWGQRGR